MININDIKIGQKVWYQEHWSQMIVWGKVTKITKFDNNEDGIEVTGEFHEEGSFVGTTTQPLNNLFATKYEAIQAIKKARQQIVDDYKAEITDIASIDDTADCGCENEYTVLNYIVDRYKDHVDKDLLNVIADTDEYALIDKKYTYNDGLLSSDVIHPVKAFDLSTACGTKEEIEADQKWMARYNYAAQIQKLAEDDYEQHRQSVSLTVGNKIIPRTREICKSFVKGELSNCTRKQTFSIWYNGNTGADYKFGYNCYSNKSDMKCTFSGKAPSVALVIEPKNVDELAFVCGCKKEELPEQIQHWKKGTRYCGNQLLYRLDPMSFKVSDPFQKMTFKIVILLSKKEYLNICDEAGVKRDKFWELEKPSCFRYNRFEDNDTCCGRNTYDPEAKCLVSLKKCRKCKFFKQQ